MAQKNTSEINMSREENKLGEKLWDIIEGPEGYAFISDAIIGIDDKAVIKVAKASLVHFENCVKILKKFIKENE